MARTSVGYLRMLQALLPKGRAWNTKTASDLLGGFAPAFSRAFSIYDSEGCSVLTQFLLGEAEEFARVDGRSNDLLVERDVRQASELLIDHETDLGLPDGCSPENYTTAERRVAAYNKTILYGRQNPRYYEEIAEAFGKTVWIDEYQPFWCGTGVSGAPCGAQWVIFYWRATINPGPDELIYFTCGISPSNTALIELVGYLINVLCWIDKYKPAHTVLIIDYNGFAFSNAFDQAFDVDVLRFTRFWQGAFSRDFSLAFDVYDRGGSFNSLEFDLSCDSPLKS